MTTRKRAYTVELVTGAALIVAPFVLPYLGFAPTTINRILIWGLFGLGFDILFGYTGLISFGQSAFFGTGGMFAAYLLTTAGFPYVVVSLIAGTIVAGIIGYLIGLIALRRTGIYFAMITVAIAQVFFFIEFNPLSEFTGGENGLPGVPAPSLHLGFTTLSFGGPLSMYGFLAFWYFVGLVLALRIVRSPVGVILSAIRDNPLRAQALGHNIHSYKLAAFVVAAMYAGFAGGLLGLMQGFMPPDAFMFDTSAQVIMQTAIGGAGTLFGPLVGAVVWFYLSDFFQSTLHLGATWKLVLGLVFVLLVIFLRRGIVGAIVQLYELATGGRKVAAPAEAAAEAAFDPAALEPMPPRQRGGAKASGPILQATGLSRHYGGVIANSNIDFSVERGEMRGIIGPNGAGKSTFFKMLTCEVPPSSGKIVFEGRDITSLGVNDVCQLGLTKSYQVNQLFTGLTARENVTIAALAQLRGKFRMDMLRDLTSVKGLTEQVDDPSELVVAVPGGAVGEVGQLIEGLVAGVQQPVLDQADRQVQVGGVVVERAGVRRRVHRWPAWNSPGSRANRAGPPITLAAAGVGSCSRACSSIRAILVTSTTSRSSARAQAASVAAGPKVRTRPSSR